MKKYLKFAVLLLIAALIVWYFGRNLDWGEVTQTLGQARASYLIAATLIICVGYLLRAIRWKVLLEPITESSLRELFAATTVGFTVILIIGRMGELARPTWLAMHDRRVRPTTALVTLGVERIFDLASLICFFTINLLFFDAPAGREAEFGYVKLVGNLMLAGTICGFICLIIFQRSAPKVIGWTERITERLRIPKPIRVIILSILEQLAASLGVLRDWREIFWVSFWTLCLWLAIAIPTWLVLLAFDLPISFGGAIFVMGWAAIGSVVPTPGGAAGAFHAATAGGLIFLNVDNEKAAAAAIAMHLVYFMPAVVFGFYYFVRGDISIAGIKRLLSSENEAEVGEVQSSKFKVQGS